MAAQFQPPPPPPPPMVPHAPMPPPPPHHRPAGIQNVPAVHQYGGQQQLRPGVPHQNAVGHPQLMTAGPWRPPIGVTKPTYWCFEFTKPPPRDMPSDEKPRWDMVWTYNQLAISSDEVQRRIKKRRAKSSKTVVDEYQALPSADLRRLVNGLVTDRRAYEWEASKDAMTWNWEMIETDTRKYVQSRAEIRHVAAMRVYLQRHIKPEVTTPARSFSLPSQLPTGNIGLNAHQPVIGWHSQNVPIHGVPGAYQAAVAYPQGVPPQQYGGVMNGQPSAAVNVPGGYRPPPQQAAQLIPPKPKAAIATKEQRGNPRERSRDRGKHSRRSSRRRRSSSYSSDSGSSSDSDGDSRSRNKRGNLQFDVRDFVDVVTSLDRQNRRSSNAPRLPPVPMGPYHSSNPQRRASMPSAGKVKLVERFHMGSSDNSRYDGYSSGGGDSYFSRPPDIHRFTPPSSPDAHSPRRLSRPYGNYREHEKPGPYGENPTPPLTPEMDYVNPRRHSDSRNRGRRQSVGNPYFGNERPKDHYRRQAEDAADHIDRARRQYEESDRYVRSEYRNGR